MFNSIKEYLQDMSTTLLDERLRQKAICLFTYATLSVVALVMTIINFATDSGTLTTATGVVTALCIFNILLALGNNVTIKVSMILFGIEMAIMFTYFIVSGAPSGFSILWLALAPSIAMTFYGRKFGALFSAFMLVVLIFLLRTPIGFSLLRPEAKLGYDEVFKLRFPFLYIACFLIAYILKVVEDLANNKVAEMRETFETLAVHDQLTGVYNREGLMRALADNPRFIEAESVGVAMLDVDHFKGINDTYGHDAGDYILKTFADLLTTKLNVIACRWGGDEFAFVYASGDVSIDQMKDFCKFISEYEFVFEGERIPVTISIGVALNRYFDTKLFSKYIGRADNMLYEAKAGGRNQVAYDQQLQTNY